MTEDRLIEGLSWNKSKEENDISIDALVKGNCDLAKLIQPKDKSTWENCALVLKMIGYPRISSVLKELFLWLRDLTWPGAQIIFDLLKTVPHSILIPYFNKSLNMAIADKDWDFVYSLKLFF